MLWLVPLELESVLLDVNRSIKAKLYYPALLVSLTLPDICVATTLDRDMFVKEKHYVEWLERYTDKASLGISPIDCYRLRCGVVHRGNFSGNPKFGFTHVIFTVPETKSKLHGPSVIAGEKKSLLLDLISFCKEMETAARRWFQDHKSDPKVAEDMRNLIRFCPNGIMPFVSGLAVVASGE
jgi:hypothetical protein